ncbi:hypothetical protein [Marilutibacter aestuarii]|uniref:DUF3784 domain-containing protein n=1 Tax=Marilutibacter aestuarii TaxID=1706195 RepID=A0A507ZZ24_9GAMM|nr:hypothetical protein [Lysobacter aestuarii]TQD40968.1 hypothetical protein FKV25_14090 [Lysobacter aestuarii]
MDARDLLVPALLFAGSLPMFAIAWRIGHGDLHWVNGLDARRLRDPAAVARRLARLLALVGVALVLGAAGLYVAGDDEGRMIAVVLVLLLVVNGLGLALFRAAGAARRDYLPGPRPTSDAGAGDGTGRS